MSILPSTTLIHISPFKISCYCFIAKDVSLFFPQFWSVSDTCGDIGRRQKSLSFSFTPINYVDFPPALHAKLPLPLWVPLRFDPALPPSFSGFIGFSYAAAPGSPSFVGFAGPGTKVKLCLCKTPNLVCPEFILGKYWLRSSIRSCCL